MADNDGSFDVNAVVGKMLQSARAPLEKYWKTAEPIAKEEFTKIAEMVKEVEAQRFTHTITAEDVRDRLDMLKQAAVCALDTQEGLAEIACEDAINAALASVSSIINGHFGLTII